MKANDSTRSRLLPLAVTVAILMFIGHVVTPKDDTDPKPFWSRSGLGLYIDARTGCHYVKAGYFGGTTPRLDANGKQICEAEK